jgi:hypothetical protein
VGVKEAMKRWVCQQAQWLILGGYLLLLMVYFFFEEGLLP